MRSNKTNKSGSHGVLPTNQRDSIGTSFSPVDPPLNRDELVVAKSGTEVRQAGADVNDGAFIKKLRHATSQDLYAFCKIVLNFNFLSPFHREVCSFLQRRPPFRKLLIEPREHGKTLIGAHGLPLHIIIQEADSNVYFPGLDGSENRILMCGETLRRATDNLQVLESEAMENRLLRGLWPHKFWDQPRRQSKMWSKDGLIFPRKTNWPNPTIWPAGVGTAVTGSRPTVLIKDDLISVEARNSDVTMANAIQWHRDTRALLDSFPIESGLHPYEFILGTRWAVYDLYSYIEDNDPSVEIIDRKFWQIHTNGTILWPEKHTMESIDQLRLDHGHMFFFHYMNNPADSLLVDFDLDKVREFKLVNGSVIFETDERDVGLTKSTTGIEAPPVNRIGMKLTPELMKEMGDRNETFSISMT